MLLDPQTSYFSWRKKIIINLLIALFYFLAGNLEVLFNSIHFVFPFWAPSGVAIALMLVYGLINVLPGIASGLIILALMSNAPLVSIAGLMCAGVLEGAIAYFLLLSISKDKFTLKYPKDVFAFITVAGLLSPFLSATIDVTAMYMGDMLGHTDVPSRWISFFARNSLGILIFAPFIMSFYRPSRSKVGYLEATVTNVLLILLTYWAFANGNGAKKFIIIPLLTWIALRYSFRGISVATGLISCVVLIRSSAGLPVFDPSPEKDLLIIQTMTGAIGIAGYFMATVLEAQERAHQKEIELNLNVQGKKIAEEALVILDQTINESSIGYALYDREFRYLRINKTLAKLNRVSQEESLGKKVEDIIPEVAPKILPIIASVFRTGESYHNIPYTDDVRSLGLKNFSALLSYYPVRDPVTGEIFAVAGSVQDITQIIFTQNLLSENQDRLAFAQEAGKIGVFEVDLATNKVNWTPQLENIYGLAPGEFNGVHESWIKWVHPEDQERINSAFRTAVETDQELNFEYRIIRRKHDVRWILARGRIWRDANGNPVKFIGINIDLTDQKETEFKLRVTEANLLHALSIRDEFVAIASHELKTPLTSLKLQTQLMERNITRGDIHSHKLLSNLDKNSKQIDRITRLVNDMLDISRIRTGKLTLKKEACELSSMLKDIISRSQEQFKESGSGDPVIEEMDEAHGEWDPLRIEQVITNVINNAIRYGQGKPITVGLKNDQEWIRITVKDQGRGITRSDQGKIFQKYERGILNKEVSGLGLGLYISQQIVIAHGGIISVESEVNKGSTFTIDLPRMSMDVIPDGREILTVES